MSKDLQDPWDSQENPDREDPVDLRERPVNLASLDLEDNPDQEDRWVNPDPLVAQDQLVLQEREA